MPHLTIVAVACAVALSFAIAGCRSDQNAAMPQSAAQPIADREPERSSGAAVLATSKLDLIAPECVDRMSPCLRWTVVKLKAPHSSEFIGCFIMELSGYSSGQDTLPQSSVGFRTWDEARVLISKIHPETPIEIPLELPTSFYRAATPFFRAEIPPEFERFVSVDK